LEGGADIPVCGGNFELPFTWKSKADFHGSHALPKSGVARNTACHRTPERFALRMVNQLTFPLIPQSERAIIQTLWVRFPGDDSY
jgi:hypothetical protein